MGDCTTCRFDQGTGRCMQGHYRGYELFPDKPYEWIPIQGCHAWKEKECVCSGIRISRAVQDALDGFDIICRTCGKKKGPGDK